MCSSPDLFPVVFLLAGGFVHTSPLPVNVSSVHMYVCIHTHTCMHKLYTYTQHYTHTRCTCLHV